jgi:hypothetical protein
MKGFKEVINQFLRIGRLNKHGKKTDKATPWGILAQDANEIGEDKRIEEKVRMGGVEAGCPDREDNINNLVRSDVHPSPVAQKQEGTPPKLIDKSPSCESPESSADEEHEMELLKWQFELLVNAIDETFCLKDRPESKEGIAFHFFRSRQELLRQADSALR